jgi:hypothetical protein
VAEAEGRLMAALAARLAGADAAAAQGRDAAAALRKAEAAERAAGRLKSELRGLADDVGARLAALSATAVVAPRPPADGLSALAAEVADGARTAEAAEARLRRQLDELAADVRRLGARLDEQRDEAERAAERHARALGESAAAVHEAGGDDALQVLARVEAAEERAGGRLAAIEARIAALERQQQGPSGAASGAAAMGQAAAPGGAQQASSMAALDAMISGGGGGDGIFGAGAQMVPTCTSEREAPRVRAPQLCDATGSQPEDAADDRLDAPASVVVGRLEGRIAHLEEQLRDQMDALAAPVDGLTASALMARISLLEDDYLERRRRAEEEEERAAAAAKQQQLSSQPQLQQQRSTGSQEERQPADAMTVVDALGEHIDALLTRFAPTGSGNGNGSGVVSRTTSDRPLFLAPSPPAAELASLAARISALEASVQSVESAGGAADVQGRLEVVEEELAAARREHAEAVAAAADRSSEVEARGQQQAAAAVARAEAVSTSSEAAAAAAAAVVAQLQARVRALEKEMAALVEATARATASAAQAAEAAGEAEAAADAPAAAGARAGDLQGDVDGLAKQLYELRVEMQNGAEDAAGRIRSLEAQKDDHEIWQSGQRAAAERAERAAADALERAEELAAAVAAAGPAAAAAAEALVAAAVAESQVAMGDELKRATGALQLKLEELQQHVAGVTAQQQQLRAAQEATANDAVQATASASAAAELTLRLQAGTAEAGARLESLADQLALARAALDEHASRLTAADTAAGRLEEISGALADTTGRVLVVEAAAEAAGAKAEAASQQLAALQPVLAQLQPVLEASDVLTPMSGPAGAPQQQRGLLPALRGCAQRFSTDSVDSPSFAGRADGTVTYPNAGASPPLSPPSRTASGSGAEIDGAAPPPRAYENRLFGIEDSSDGGAAAAANAAAAVAATAASGIPLVPVVHSGAPLSLYTNAAFEDDQDGSPVRGPVSSSGGTGPVAGVALLVSPAGAVGVTSDGGVAGDTACWLLFSSDGGLENGGAGFVAAPASTPAVLAAPDEPPAVEAAEGEAGGEGVLVSVASLKVKADDAAEESPPASPGLITAFRPAGELQQHPEVQQQHATDQLAEQEQPQQPVEEAAVASPPAAESVARAFDILANSFGGAESGASTGGGSETRKGQGRGRGDSGGGSEAGSSRGRGRVAFERTTEPARGSPAAGRRGGRRSGPTEAGPPPAVAAPPSVALKHAPEAEDKGPSEIDLAKQLLERAAASSPGRVRRQAMATETMIAVIAAGSDSDSSSPQRSRGGASAGGAWQARLAPAVANRLQPLAAPPVPPPIQQQPAADSADTSAEAPASAATTTTAAAGRAPSPYGLMDLSGSDADSELLPPLPGLDAAPARSPLASFSGPPSYSGGANQQQQQQQQQQAAAQAEGGTSNYMVRLAEPDDVMRLRGGASRYNYSQWDLSDDDSPAGSPVGVASSPFAWKEHQLAAVRTAAAAPHRSCGSSVRTKRRLLGGFYCGAEGQEGQLIKAAADEVPPAASDVQPDSPPLPLTQMQQQPPPQQPTAPSARSSATGASGYRVVILTNAARGSGTDGLVTLRIRTTAGSSIEIPLNTARGTFADGSRLEFMLEECSGRNGGSSGSGGGAPAGCGVESVTVMHDGEGYANAWLLDKLVVQELSTGAFE